MEKREEIKTLVMELILSCFEDAKNDVDKVMRSGSIDIEGWNKDKEGYVLPKIIATAILEKQARQYSGIGTKYEKRIKKESKNIQCFL